MFLQACVILSTLSTGGSGVGYLWSHVLSVGVGYHWFHGPSGGGVGYLVDRVSRGCIYVDICIALAQRQWDKQILLALYSNRLI